MIKLAKNTFLLLLFNQMFGMALKFIQLNIQPLFNKAQLIPQLKQNHQINKKQQTPRKKQQSREIHSTEKKQYQAYSEEQETKSQNLQEKQYPKKIEKEHFKYQSSEFHINKNQESQNLEELKTQQIKIIQDFKNSMVKNEQKMNNQNLNKGQFLAINQNEQFSFQKQKFLSKIDELSQQYLENSSSKYNNIFVRCSQNNNTIEKMKVSAQFVHSIVRSVIYGSQQQELHKRTGSQQSLKIYDYCNYANNFESWEFQAKQLEAFQPGVDFLKQLFQSLGLIEKKEEQQSTLKQLIITAKTNFSKLKGNDYIEKLNQMLKSVDSFHIKNDLKSQTIENTKQLMFCQISCDRKIQSNIHRKQEPINEINLTILKNFQTQTQQKRPSIIKQANKKVKILIPQSVFQIQKKIKDLQNQILQSIQFLTHPRRLKKYSFHSMKASEVILNFSFDFKFMCYKHIKGSMFTAKKLKSLIRQICSCNKKQFQRQINDEDNQKIVSLQKNMVNVSKGIKTKNFIKYEQLMGEEVKNINQYTLSQDRCFSLLFKDRTYDFECQNSSIRDLYFKSLRVILKNRQDF